MKSVYLARHGHLELPTGGDGVQLLYGPNDPLSQKGFEQADMLADFLFKTAAFARIETSPNLRAFQKAERISIKFGGIPIISHKGLRAADLLYYSNQPLVRFLQDGQNPFSVAHEGNETLEEYEKRVLETFEEITFNRNDPVLIVGHGEAIKLLMHRLRHPEGPPSFGESVDYGQALGLTLDEYGKLIHSVSIPEETKPRGELR